MIRCLFHLLHQSFHIGYLCTVGSQLDGLSTWTFVGKGIEGCAGLLAGGGFAGGYLNFGGAGLNEASDGSDGVSIGYSLDQGQGGCTQKQSGGLSLLSRL